MVLDTYIRLRRTLEQTFIGPVLISGRCVGLCELFSIHRIALVNLH